MKRMKLVAQGRKLGAGSELNRLRTEGMVPAILYGKDQEPTPISVVLRDMDKAVDTNVGFNILFDLEIDGKETIIAMIRDYQSDPLKRVFSHIDFQKIDITKKIHMDVRVKAVGEALGVKEGGILTLQRRILEVLCLPTNVPNSIEVDVSGLDIGDSIHIREITLPDGVELAHKDVDYTVVAVTAPTKIEVAVPVVAEGIEGADGVIPVEGAAPAEGAEGSAPAEGEEKKEVKKEAKKEARKEAKKKAKE
ncbi:50S ribosomal protein L25 [bacterium]|nr:50S ribosomal protein L25 [bacterium]